MASHVLSHIRVGGILDEDGFDDHSFLEFLEAFQQDPVTRLEPGIDDNLVTQVTSEEDGDAVNFIILAYCEDEILPLDLLGSALRDDHCVFHFHQDEVDRSERPRPDQPVGIGDGGPQGEGPGLGVMARSTKSISPRCS